MPDKRWAECAQRKHQSSLFQGDAGLGLSLKLGQFTLDDALSLLGRLPPGTRGLHESSLHNIDVPSVCRLPWGGHRSPVGHRLRLRRFEILVEPAIEAVWVPQNAATEVSRGRNSALLNPVVDSTERDIKQGSDVLSMKWLEGGGHEKPWLWTPRVKLESFSQGRRRLAVSGLEHAGLNGQVVPPPTPRPPAVLHATGASFGGLAKRRKRYFYRHP